MVLIALGGNLPHPDIGAPLDVLRHALGLVKEAGMALQARSNWYLTRPVPVSDQPWFVNGVVAATTDLSPRAVLDALHRIEADLGRVRRERNAARIVDLDLLDYDGRIIGDPARKLAGELVLPHPLLHERRFVLAPLYDIAPDWRHPVLRETAATLLKALPPADLDDTLPVPDARPWFKS